MSITVHPDWWKTLFDDLYLKTDARSVCSEEVCGREVDVICELLKPQPGQRVLDLCGGHGRHSLEMAGRGLARCTVLDFSHSLIKRGLETARERGVQVRFIRGDARRTALKDGSFDHVIIMGNSLGYLADPSGDVSILSEAQRLMKPESRLLVDITDGEKARREMARNAWHQIDRDLVVCRQREFDDGVVRAREMVFSRRTGLVRDQSYAIRLFTPRQLTRAIEDAGFEAVRLHRDFQPLGEEGDYGFMNRRILATAMKPAQREIST